MPNRAPAVQPLKPQSLNLTLCRPRSNRREWGVNLPRCKALASPAVGGDSVYLGGGFGSFEFYAFDARSGRTKWGVRISDDGPTAAVVAKGKVVFNTESCTLFVLDGETGEVVWARWLGDPLLSQPAISDERVIVAHPSTDGYRLTAFGLFDGTKVWSTAIEGDVISAPIIAGDRVYLSTFAGTVYSASLENGELLWGRPYRATSAPIVAGDRIYVAQRTRVRSGRVREGVSSITWTGDLVPSRETVAADYLDERYQRQSEYSRVTIIDDERVGFGTGPPAWVNSASASANVGQGTVRGLWEYQGSRPALWGSRLFATFGGVVRCLGSEGGQVIWEHTLPGSNSEAGGHFGTPPAIANGLVYVATIAGDLLVLDSANGQALATFAIGEPVRTQPVISGGRVFVGTTRGGLVSIDLRDACADGWPMWGGGPGHNGLAQDVGLDQANGVFSSRGRAARE